MKLGVTGLLPGAAAEVDAAAVRRVAAMGFIGTALNVGDPPGEISTERAREIGRICAGEGVEVVEYGQFQTTFVAPDETIRSATLATVREACRVARAVGCPAVIVGIGSHNPADEWFPHPENYSQATRERLIGALSEAARIAEGEGVVLALECHVTTSLRNAATAREVLDAVGSPVLKVHLDPVNWMTFETVYDNGPAIAVMFATLGAGRISGAHSKGVRVENELIVHLNETHTGADDDLIDHASVLRGLAGLPGEPFLVIEHLTVDQMPGARLHLLEIAGQLGLSFAGGSGGRV
ncbi:MAG TPA: sugar phosphate isomerase/epimerase [Thermomicrobiales bacterium]|nr:sugar phosphate isomerase/epimerase [Thermomicrobiales bacterium]